MCGLATINVQYPSLFNNLMPDFKPIAVKSKEYSQDDKQFIKTEVMTMLGERVIESSESPWRAQVLITSSENHKEGLVID